MTATVTTKSIIAQFVNLFSYYSTDFPFIFHFYFIFAHCSFSQIHTKTCFTYILLFFLISFAFNEMYYKYICSSIYTIIQYSFTINILYLVFHKSNLSIRKYNLHQVINKPLFGIFSQLFRGKDDIFFHNSKSKD